MGKVVERGRDLSGIGWVRERREQNKLGARMEDEELSPFHDTPSHSQVGTEEEEDMERK